jgi:hypothetical protein
LTSPVYLYLSLTLSLTDTHTLSLSLILSPTHSLSLSRGRYTDRVYFTHICAELNAAQKGRVDLTHMVDLIALT